MLSEASTNYHLLLWRAFNPLAEHLLSQQSLHTLKNEVSDLTVLTCLWLLNYSVQLTKLCLCLMLFVQWKQTKAFHGLQLYSLPASANVNRIQTPWLLDKAVNLCHMWSGWVRASGVTGLCSTSTTTCDAWSLAGQKIYIAVRKQTYPILSAALSDLQERRDFIHKVLHPSTTTDFKCKSVQF